MTDNIIKFPRTQKRRKNLEEVLVDRLTDMLILVMYRLPVQNVKADLVLISTM